MMDTEIGFASDEDRPSIMALQLASWQDSYIHLFPDSYLQTGLERDLNAHWQGQDLSEDVFVLAAWQDQELSGFVTVILTEEGGFIDNMHVHPKLRGQGLGENLMRAAFDHLLQRDVSHAYLWVNEDNIGAQNFYRRLGGRFGAVSEKLLFGYPVRAIRVDWDDLGPLTRPVP